ncbi:MAG: OprO/OprP family phosphate-selective porin [Planctomycetes bacterium]|nr:OprO/OprP family phosphate-selective porin [Planctomycetota bacterium]
MRNVVFLLLLTCLTGVLSAQGAEIRKRSIGFETEGFALDMQTQIQFRLTFQEELAQSGQGGTNGRDFINFNLPRVRLRLNGHIFDDNFQYRLRLNFSRPAAELLEIAHFRYALMRPLNFNAGQDKLPWNWEEPVDSLDLSFQERSYVNEVFNQDYAKGVWLDGEIGDQNAPWVKYWFGVYGGLLRAQDDFRNKDGQLTTDAFSDVIDAEIMVNIRIETHPLGRVARGMVDLRDETENDKILFAIGAGFNWFSSGMNNADLRLDTAAAATGSGRSRVQQETYAVTLDGHFRFWGIAVDAAVYWRYTDFHNRGINKYTPADKQGIGDVEDFGWSFEASWVTPWLPLSVGVRVNSLDADEFWGANAALLQTDQHQRAIRPDAMEIGVTASYRLHGERLKFSLDILYVDQQLAYTYDGSGFLLGVYNEPQNRRGSIGSSPANADHDALWIVRLQVQWIL